ncbi:Ig-like domain-containing protein [Isoalcanivorax indicus]|uniref:Ig-like domain-containing protein n=1 Tax=Isoalcanivorax indicus TaxID=2202653 RepID=UPI0013C5079C|nr:Ig-like domain-containing protein [Isoalcanivorax indicus]
MSNIAPVADSQSVVTNQDTALLITLSGSDADGDLLTYAIASAPANGSLSGTAPNVTYTPNTDFSGADSFTFTVNDGTVSSAPATVAITVNAIPVANPQSVETDQQAPLLITLTGSDADDDALTYEIETSPANGSLTGTPPAVTYTPNAGFVGTDSFAFTVDDGMASSAAASVTITVNAVFPDTPGDLAAASGLAPGAVDISWSPSVYASGYNLYLAAEPLDELANWGSYDGSQLIAVSDTTHTLTLPPGVWHFRVAATNVLGESDGSDGVAMFNPVGGLNDTGIDWCSGGVAFESGHAIHTHLVDCDDPGVESFPGQDGMQGRDADPTLVKLGDGDAGFDFTKLDSSGEPLDASATEWGCVRDNVTGLIWEVKVDDVEHLRHRAHTYRWYNPDGTSNGSNVGGEGNGDSCNHTLEKCNTLALVEAVNSLSGEDRLCGATDWRLPTVGELHSIVHFGVSNPSIDQDYFPNTDSQSFWSSTAVNWSHANVVVFFRGTVSWAWKNPTGAVVGRVRLVRDAP